MRARRPALVLLAALALSACGPSKEEERVKELARLCNAAVGTTVRDLEIAYGGTGIRIAVNPNDGSLTCGTGVTRLACSEGPSHCVMGFLFPASNDPNVCNQQGCYFTCSVRAEQDELKAHEEDRAAPICGAQWIEHQPIPPFYGDPFWGPGMLP